MTNFEVNPDISEARTLSTDFYLLPEHFKKAKENIFAKSWHLIGDTDQVKENGWVTPVHLLENYLDEPLILSRDKQGALHCMSNVCTHRGNLIIENPCKLNDIRCKYHGRRINLNGKFLSMPEFKEVKGFPTEADDLTNLPLHNWGKLLFTSLNKSNDPEPYFKEMIDRVS